MDIISTRANNVLHKALDGILVKHDAISSNLANIDTPGYKPLRVDFEDSLRQAIEKEDKQQDNTKGMKINNFSLNFGLLELNKTHPKHYGAETMNLGDIKVNAYEDEKVSFRVDENGIDIDSEMAELAKNSMKYEALAAMASRNSNLMKDIIRSTGG